LSTSSRAPAAAPPTLDLRRERALTLVVAAVQLVNVLEFMIVMPLGPDIAKALDFRMDAVGVVGGAYTAAGAVSGVVGALILDRFDRKRVLVVTMIGLIAATVLGGLARSLESLIAARVLAGAFGGPATSVSIAIVSDVVPVVRRGRAMAIVMGAFTISSIFGVPAALELAEAAGAWSAPFFGVAALGVVVIAVAVAALPSMTGHLSRGDATSAAGLGAVLRRPEALLALTALALTMMSLFSIVPNLSAYLQFNAGWPREHLSQLYAAGGVVGLVIMALSGRAIDRWGSAPVVTFSALWVTVVIAIGILPGKPLVHTMLFFVLFMGGTSIRNVAMNALTSRVPPPAERARYQSVQSAVQHLACAIGAMASTQLIEEQPDHSLAHMDWLGTATIVASLIVPFLAFAIERRVRARERATDRPSPT
jgi:predicted MFS family arabinose efflux permease